MPDEKKKVLAKNIFFWIEKQFSWGRKWRNFFLLDKKWKKKRFGPKIVFLDTKNNLPGGKMAKVFGQNNWLKKWWKNDEKMMKKFYLVFKSYWKQVDQTYQEKKSHSPLWASIAVWWTWWLTRRNHIELAMKRWSRIKNLFL